MQILVADPDPGSAAVIQFHLRRGRHHVVVTGTAVAALAAATQAPPPQVAVLDTRLPGMTAFELLDKLRDIQGLGRLGAVAVTDRTRPGDIDQAQKMGAAYLISPFSGADLLAAVDTAAGHGRTTS